jgi:hypothetical protein
MRCAQVELRILIIRLKFRACWPCVHHLTPCCVHSRGYLRLIWWWDMLDSHDVYPARSCSHARTISRMNLSFVIHPLSSSLRLSLHLRVCFSPSFSHVLPRARFYRQTHSLIPRWRTWRRSWKSFLLFLFALPLCLSPSPHIVLFSYVHIPAALTIFPHRCHLLGQPTPRIYQTISNIPSGTISKWVTMREIGAYRLNVRYSC